MTIDVPSTRERILRSGLDLMSEAGLAGITLGLLAEQTGLSKSGLFAHFRSKEDLQLALLREAASFTESSVVLPTLEAPEGLPRLEALVGHWLGWTQRAGLRGGCPVAAATFELDDAEGLIRERVLVMATEWHDFLAKLVREAIGQGHLRRDLDVDQFVWELNGIYLSHHASYRFVRDSNADVRAETAFQALIQRARLEDELTSGTTRFLHKRHQVNAGTGGVVVPVDGADADLRLPNIL